MTDSPRACTRELVRNNVRRSRQCCQLIFVCNVFCYRALVRIVFEACKTNRSWHPLPFHGTLRLALSMYSFPPIPMRKSQMSPSFAGCDRFVSSRAPALSCRALNCSGGLAVPAATSRALLYQSGPSLGYVAPSPALLLCLARAMWSQRRLCDTRGPRLTF